MQKTIAELERRSVRRALARRNVQPVECLLFSLSAYSFPPFFSFFFLRLSYFLASFFLFFI
jgi:hypothetical protein